MYQEMKNRSNLASIRLREAPKGASSGAERISLAIAVGQTKSTVAEGFPPPEFYRLLSDRVGSVLGLQG